MMNYVEVNQLCVDVGLFELFKIIVYDVSFMLKCGEVLVLIGEFGLGKIIIVLLLLGYVCLGCCLSSGVVNVGNDNMFVFNEK